MPSRIFANKAIVTHHGSIGTGRVAAKDIMGYNQISNIPTKEDCLIKQACNKTA